MSQDTTQPDPEKAEAPDWIPQLLQEVIPGLRETDEQFWDDIEKAFASSSGQDPSDRYFTDVDWLAHLLRNDPESAVVDVTNKDRDAARAFIGVLMFASYRMIEDSSLPPNVSKRLKQLIRVYGPVVSRAYERSFRAHDWEIIDLGLSTPVGATVDQYATVKIVIQRFDGQVSVLQTRPEGAVAFTRHLLRQLNDSLDEESIAAINPALIGEIIDIANDLASKISNLGHDEEDGSGAAKS